MAKKSAKKSGTNSCPCGSGGFLTECCGPVLDGLRLAESAEVLMRSRYTAFTFRKTDYLLQSWHASTRPVAMDTNPDQQWTNLKIVNAHDGGPDDRLGSVEFIARYKVNGRADKIHEVSEFVKESGRWFYLSSEFRTG